MNQRIAGIAVFLMLALVVVVVSIAGVHPPTSDSNWSFHIHSIEENTPIETKQSTGHPGPQGEIHLGLYNTHQPELQRIFVKVNLEHYRYEEVHHEDVMLCVYDETGSVVRDEVLGTISTEDGWYSDEFRFNSWYTEFPQYIIVDHPELRDHESITTETLVWDTEEGEYLPTRSGLSEIQDEFEWPRSSEPGQCG